MNSKDRLTKIIKDSSYIDIIPGYENPYWEWKLVYDHIAQTVAYDTRGWEQIGMTNLLQSLLDCDFRYEYYPETHIWRFWFDPADMEKYEQKYGGVIDRCL